MKGRREPKKHVEEIFDKISNFYYGSSKEIKTLFEIFERLTFFLSPPFFFHFD